MPTVQGIPGPYRFYFYRFDCNEAPHIHVCRERRTCKFWIEPIELGNNHGFSARELNQIHAIIDRHLGKFRRLGIAGTFSTLLVDTPFV